MDANTAHALIRFGLGPRAGEDAPAHIRSWLRAQLHAPDTADFSALPTTSLGLAAIVADREDKKAGVLDPPHRVRDICRQDMTAQLNQAIDGSAPFRERLVLFWANHFTVSTRAGPVAAVAGSFVREAIRPYVTGKFEDMALSVLRHPAMLLYLDNAGSVGPNSKAGQNKGRGLNENLARETMELHTLGVDGGYTQRDVTEFARVITGWSVELRGDTPGYVFRPRAHDPGNKTVMGQTYGEGELAGLAAINFLANHPATHRHLARKLAAHFIADDPPPAACAHLEQVLQESGGDLLAVSLALVDMPQIWTPPGGPLCKLRTPLDYVIAAMRALGQPPDQRPDLPGLLNALGQPMWRAPAPNGWSDRADAWATPDAMLLRVDWAYRIAGKQTMPDGMGVAISSLGPLLQPSTQLAIQRAGSRRDALTLALSSPEFLRR